MVITYYGVSCFKVQSGETVIAFDPPSKASDEKSPRFETHLVFISHDHPRHSGGDVLNAKDGDYMIIETPGEYEAKGIRAEGIRSFHDNQSGKKHGLNTIYKVEMEGISICHLGDFGEKNLKSEVREAIGSVDILFIPVGGETVLDAEDAAAIVNQIDPSIVIPMHYDKASLKTFLKEMGQGEEEEDKLTIKKKEINAEETKVVVLKPAF
jgi:L-ascorbate metabolism protein UlaG (beta-lactamase superfamily)